VDRARCGLDDELAAEMSGPAVVEPVVDFLARLAGDGAALELGIGTGRIALPLAQRGVPVEGMDISAPMVAKLRAKPGGEDIRVTIGDFATTRVDATFSVVYLAWNAITNLLTQDEQVACFENAAAHLKPGGLLVVDVAQIEVSHHFWKVENAFEASSAPYRYVWPSELDLMARLAGVRLRERWGGWKREPFTSESTQHVSVWEKPPPRGD
jgi:SAM-dependent methyltransferase